MGDPSCKFFIFKVANHIFYSSFSEKLKEWFSARGPFSIFNAGVLLKGATRCQVFEITCAPLTGLYSEEVLSTICLETFRG